jgi:hypothetical protein
MELLFRGHWQYCGVKPLPVRIAIAREGDIFLQTRMITGFLYMQFSRLA